MRKWRNEKESQERDKKWVTETYRGNAALLSSHHRELIVSNPLTHIGGTDKHTPSLSHTHILSIWLAKMPFTHIHSRMSASRHTDTS